jgi:hypothetical protein
VPNSNRQELQLKVREIQLRVLRQRQHSLGSGGNTKKKAKPVGYKMQNTFEKSLKGVPGGSMSRGVASSLLKQMQAPNTGTKVVAAAPGLMKSMRNANTTQGHYNTTVLQDQTGDVISNAQGQRL